MNAWFSDLQTKFVTDFIEDDRYLYIVDGLKTTLIVTFLALILGLIIGAGHGIISFPIGLLVSAGRGGAPVVGTGAPVC